MTTMTNRQAEDNELTARSFWWLRVEGVDGRGRGEARESEPAALVHDYSKNIICIREWNPNMLKSRMVTNQKSPPCRRQLKLKTYC